MKLSAPALELELSPRRLADDEDWCRIQVLARTNGIHSDFEAWLQSGDLVHFAEELNSLHAQIGRSGSATLSTAEGEVYVQLSMQALGGVSGVFELKPESQSDGASVLSGTFQVDQSYLQPLRESSLALAAVLQGKSAA